MGVAALAGLLSSCSDDDGRFFIVQNQVPLAPCTVTTERNIYSGEGLMDVALVRGDAAFGYDLFPLLQNDLPASGLAGSPEPNRLFVRAFRVRVEPGAGAPAALVQLFDRLSSTDQSRPLVEFQNPWAGTINPGGGLMAAGVGVVPGELARQIRAMRILDTTPTVPLIVRVRAVGQRQDGEVESKEFVFPIKACQGCLIANMRPCPYAPTFRGNGCNVAQDAMVDCCSAGVELICPATAPTGP
jgi:hypothetical protein